MKVYVSCDIEGLAGIANFDMEKEDSVRFLDVYHKHVEWLLKGIQQSDKNDEITEITISDSHSRGVNLSYRELSKMDSRVSLVSGFPRMDYMMSGLDSSYDVVIFLGYHAGIGKKYGSMDHGYSASVAYYLEINNEYMNETTINSAFASELGVPVGLIIGESGLQEQLSYDPILSKVLYVSTKESLGRYAIKNRPAEIVEKEIIDKTCQLFSKDVKQLPLYQIKLPANIMLQCATTAQADRIEMLSMIERVDGRRVKFECKTMKDAINDIVAIVGLGGTVY